MNRIVKILLLGIYGAVLMCENHVLQAMHINNAKTATLPTIQVHDSEQINNQALLEDTLLFAAYTGNVALVSACLTHGVDVNAHNEEGPTALILASYAGHSAIVRTLLAHPTTNINIRCAGWTALMNAAYFRHQHILQALLAHRNTTSQFDADLEGCEILLALGGLARSTTHLLKNRMALRETMRYIS